MKLDGEFLWHTHEREDEMFLVVRGRMRVDLRVDSGERSIEIGPGEFLVVPHGIEHRTASEHGCEALIFEPAAVRNTGDREHERFTAPDGLRL